MRIIYRVSNLAPELRQAAFRLKRETSRFRLVSDSIACEKAGTASRIGGYRLGRQFSTNWAQRFVRRWSWTWMEDNTARQPPTNAWQPPPPPGLVNTHLVYLFGAFKLLTQPAEREREDAVSSGNPKRFQWYYSISVGLCYASWGVTRRRNILSQLERPTQQCVDQPHDGDRRGMFGILGGCFR